MFFIFSYLFHQVKPKAFFEDEALVFKWHESIYMSLNGLWC